MAIIVSAYAIQLRETLLAHRKLVETALRSTDLTAASLARHLIADALWSVQGFRAAATKADQWVKSAGR